MSTPSARSRLHTRGGRAGLLAIVVVAVVAALWLAALFHTPGDSGSLDARVTAVGATVRCPICPEPIPLNDVQNPEALSMRLFIRSELQQGLNEDQVRQQLAARYGRDILLAPPQQGFDLLIWVAPLAAVAACAAGVLLALRRWSGSAGDGGANGYAPATPAGPSTPELRRYEELLDQELAARE